MKRYGSLKTWNKRGSQRTEMLGCLRVTFFRTSRENKSEENPGEENGSKTLTEEESDMLLAMPNDPGEGTSGFSLSIRNSEARFDDGILDQVQRRLRAGECAIIAKQRSIRKSSFFPFQKPEMWNINFYSFSSSWCFRANSNSARPFLEQVKCEFAQVRRAYVWFSIHIFLECCCKAERNARLTTKTLEKYPKFLQKTSVRLNKISL